MASLRPSRPVRRPSLTPMIDVVFLLLVFFMLASRFGTDMALPLPLGGGGSGYSGPPRLIEVAPDALFLNGVETAQETLVESLLPLTSVPTDTLILQGRGGATVQDIIDVTRFLAGAGFENVVLVK